MKIASVRAGLLVASLIGVNCASAFDETVLAFPDQKIGVPALSLADVAQQNRPPLFKAELMPKVAVSQQQQPKAALSSDEKFVIKPDQSVDYKLLIKSPNSSVDYRLIVKDPFQKQDVPKLP